MRKSICVIFQSCCNNKFNIVIQYLPRWVKLRAPLVPLLLFTIFIASFTGMVRVGKRKFDPLVFRLRGGLAGCCTTASVWHSVTPHLTAFRPIETLKPMEWLKEIRTGPSFVGVFLTCMTTLHKKCFFCSGLCPPQKPLFSNDSVNLFHFDF